VRWARLHRAGRRPSYAEAISIARDFVDDGSNYEYTRGVVEMIADLYGYQGACDMDEAKERICLDLGLPPTTLA
jgi:hypothetical protein